MSGLYAFDRYQISQGNPSPIAEMVDFAGLAKVMQEEETETQVVQTRETFHETAYSSVDRLRRVHQDNHDRRLALVARRSEILQKLRRLTQDTRQEAEYFSKVIQQEEGRFLEKFPEVENIKNTIFRSQSENDAQVREHNYNRIKGDLVTMFKKVVQNPQEDLPRLQVLLTDVNALVGGSSNQWQHSCGTNQICLQNKIDGLQGDIIELVDETAKRPGEHVDTVIELTTMLEGEYRFFNENAEATEYEIKQQRDRLDSNLKNLVEELVNIGEDDVISTLKLAQKVEDEKTKLEANLKSHQDRLLKNYGSINTRIGNVMDQLDDVLVYDFDPMIEQYRENRVMTDERLDTLTSNAQEMKDLYRERLNDNKTFAESNMQRINERIEQIKQEQLEKESQKKGQAIDKLNDERMQRDATYKSNQRDRLNNIEQQLRRVRNKKSDMRIR